MSIQLVNRRVADGSRLLERREQAKEALNFLLNKNREWLAKEENIRRHILKEGTL